jgi:hypothetical protein
MVQARGFETKAAKMSFFGEGVMNIPSLLMRLRWIAMLYGLKFYARKKRSTLGKVRAPCFFSLPGTFWSCGDFPIGPS